MNVCSVYMRVMDIHVYGFDLLRVMLRSAFVRDAQAPPQASWSGITFSVSAGHSKQCPLYCICCYPRATVISTGDVPQGTCVSAGKRKSTYGCYDATCSSWCTTTTLATKIPRFLANSTHTRYDEAGTYSFFRAYHNHCRTEIMGARCLGRYNAGWHSAPLWPLASENTRLRCR